MNSTFGAPFGARTGAGHAGVDSSAVRPITPGKAVPDGYSFSGMSTLLWSRESVPRASRRRTAGASPAPDDPRVHPRPWGRSRSGRISAAQQVPRPTWRPLSHRGRRSSGHVALADRSCQAIAAAGRSLRRRDSRGARLQEAGSAGRCRRQARRRESGSRAVGRRGGADAHQLGRSGLASKMTRRLRGRAPKGPWRRNRLDPRW